MIRLHSYLGLDQSGKNIRFYMTNIIHSVNVGIKITVVMEYENLLNFEINLQIKSYNTFLSELTIIYL